MSDAVSERAPPAADGRGGGRILAALCVAAFLASLNFFATTPFYPPMARDLHTTVSLLGQVVTLMVLLSAGLGLVVGPLADRYGYRWPLVIGLLAIAGTRFAGEARRRAIGWTMGALSSAPIVGVPVLTSMSEVGGWRAALAAAGLAAAGAAWWLGWLTYLGAFLGDAVGLSTRQIGFVYTLAGGAFATGTFVAGGRLGGVSPRASVAASSVAAGLLVGPMLWLANAQVGLALLLVISLAAALCGVGVATLLAAESPAGAGTTLVLNSSLINAGTAGGAALGGVLIGLGGYGALGLGLSLFAFAAAALAWWPAARSGSGPLPV